MMMRIALLGIGAMGYGIAQRLLDSGFAVDVWNRTGKPAGLLAEYGATAHATPREAVSAADVVLIAPSNPIVSVGPILAVPGMSEALATARAGGTRIVAVSGIVGGKALKGPADRMLASLGHEPTALGVARLYAGLADTFVLDTVDAALAPAVEALGIRAVVADTIMTDDASRARLAAAILGLV